MAALGIVRRLSERKTNQSLQSWTEWPELTIAAGALDGNKEYVLLSSLAHGGNSSSVRFGQRLLVDGIQTELMVIEPNIVWGSVGMRGMMLHKFTTAATSEKISIENQNFDASTKVSHRVETELLAIPVEDLQTDDWRYGSEATSEQVSTTMTDGASVTLPSTGGDDWLIFYEAEFQAQDTSTENKAQLLVGDGGGPETFSTPADMIYIHENEDTIEQHHLGGMYVLENAAASATIKVQWGSEAGTGSSKSQTKIFALRLNAFASHDTQKSSATASIATVDTAITIASDVGPMNAGRTDTFYCFSNFRIERTGASGTRAQSAIETKVGTGGTYAFKIPGTNFGGSGDVIEAMYNSPPSNVARVRGWTESLTSGDELYFRYTAEENADVNPAYTAGPVNVAMFSAELAAVGGGGVSPSGIASAEAFGSPTITPGNVDVAPGGVASAEAFGTPTLGGEVTVSPSGIATAEAHGDHTVVPGEVSVVPGGIASAEAFGTHAVGTGAQILSPTGVASAEAIGDHIVLAEGTFPTNPRLSSISLGTDMITNVTGNYTNWTTFNNAALLNGNLLLPQSDSGIYFPRTSRNFSPWWQPTELDVDLDFTGITVKSIRFAFLSSDGTGGEAAANAGFRLRVYSNGRFDVEAKHNNGGWYQNLSGPERTVIGRVKATFDRPSTNSNSITYDITTYEGDRTTVIQNYTGTLEAAAGVNLDWKLWDPGASVSAPGSVKALLWIASAPLDADQYWVVSKLELHNRSQQGVHGTTWGPITDGLMFELPDLDPAVQTRLSRDRTLLPEAAPFSVSGVSVSTQALQDCIDTARDWGCGVYFDGGGTIRVDGQIESKQRCYERSSNRATFTDEFLPTYLRGSTNPKVITLDDSSTGFTDGTSKSTAKAVLRMTAFDYKTTPPSGEVRNAQYNNVAEGLSFDLGTNAGAYAIQNWGAQGTNILDLTVTGNGYYAAGVDVPGSGGSIAGVNATGTRKYTWEIDGSQPSCCLQDFNGDSGATAAAFFINDGPDGGGNRGSICIVGGKHTMAAGVPFVDADNVSGTDRGQFEIHDCEVNGQQLTLATPSRSQTGKSY